MPHVLPVELTSLIHYLHLNEAGWWDRGIRQLIISVIWLNGNETPAGISRALREQYSIQQLDTAIVEKHVAVLTSAGTLTRMPNGSLKIAENKLQEFEKSLKEGEERASEVRQLFGTLLATHCPGLELESTWKTFTEDLLLPLIQEMGAKTFELISGVSHRIEETKTFAAFLEKFSTEIQPTIRTTIVDFLDPKNLAVRAYVLNNLNTYFFLQAGNLSEASVEALLQITEKGHVLKLFLDTNIIFSILGFHNNPSNEAVQSLLTVVRNLSTKLDLQFYVLPSTIDETRRSLDIRRVHLANVTFSPNVASVAAELDELSGASRKFAEASLTAGRPLTPEEYFGPFLNNLLAILRAHGIELHNDPTLGSYATLQRVVDDVIQNQEFEKLRYKERRKSYDKTVHDIVLWHFVHDLRPTYLEAPFEAVEWIVTIDYRLMGFDEYKQGSGSLRLPVCLHPSALVQMLQFWVPRSPEFEKALITGFQLPFLFDEFDADAESVTIQILQTISRYESIENLPRETIGHIVLNDVLRQKIKGERDERKQIELIRDAILEVNAQLASELANSRKAAEQLQREKEKLGEVSSERESQLETVTKRVVSLEQELERQKQAAAIADTRVSDVLKSLRDSDKKSATTHAARIVNGTTALVAILIAGISYFLLEPVFDNWGWIEPFAWVISISLYVILVALGIRFEPLKWNSKLKATLANWLYSRKSRAREKKLNQEDRELEK